MTGVETFAEESRPARSQLPPPTAIANNQQPNERDPPMIDLFITFGVKYANEPHPTYSRAHPDGWLRITAPNMELAFSVVNALVGTHYAFSYTAGNFQPGYHPRGELDHWTLARDTSPRRGGCAEQDQPARDDQPARRQLTRDELSTMGPEQIRAANAGGRLDSMFGVARRSEL